MFTYQTRKVVYRFEIEPVFPSTGSVRIQLHPEQPFCVDLAGGGRTLFQGSEFNLLINMRSGKICVNASDPPNPLIGQFVGDTETLEIDGNVMTLSREFQSGIDLHEIIEQFVTVFPICLSPCFLDAPYVVGVSGEVGNAKFRRELTCTNFVQSMTTREIQVKHLKNAWDAMHSLSGGENSHIVAALRYFHTASRLAASEQTAGEFLSEVILNYSKSLEALFQAKKGEGSRDAVRSGLTTLGIPDLEIERKFMPVMALRSELDVAHVALFKLEPTQLQVVYDYVSLTEGSFRDLFEKILDKVRLGDPVGRPKSSWEPSKSVSKLIERIRVASGSSPTRATQRR